MSETSGKSIEFVKKIIQSGRCNGMENNAYKYMNEVNFTQIIKGMRDADGNLIKFINDTAHAEIPLVNKESGKEFKLNINITYNPNAEFDYFTTESCVCDGTLVFIHDLMVDVINKLTPFGTCGKIPKEAEDNLENYDIHYTVGDFVVGEEYGKQFATKEQPWLQCRFTVMLPIKCEFIKKR